MYSRACVIIRPQRIIRYPAGIIYPLALCRLSEAWIERYPADKVIHTKVGRVTFYPWGKTVEKQAAWLFEQSTIQLSN